MDIEKYLNNFYKGTKEPSLDAMKYFMDCYDNFEKNMKFIHIAGTNGKGSCTKIISNILSEQGYKVGKFLSPHLVRYNERISINGIEISNEEMAELIEELAPKIKEYNNTHKANITLFELETTMALLYFYRNNVDIVALETGLGGLYDCTNIITKPLVSIITSVGFDHMHILGNTLPEIAYQKAGIIKPNSDTVIFKETPEIDNVFIHECNNKNNTIHIITKNDITNYSYDSDFQYFAYKTLDDLSINLKGKIQIQNAAMCLEAIFILQNKGFMISIDNIKKGLKTVINKGRMETINTSPLIIYDGAHNEPAIINLRDMIDMYYKNYKKIFIVSILKRKDYKKMLELLSQNNNSTFILTSGNDSERYNSGEELFNCLKNYTSKDTILIKDLNDAVKISMDSNNDTVTFVVGSFYTYGTVLNEIKRIKNGQN